MLGRKWGRNIDYVCVCVCGREGERERERERMIRYEDDFSMATII